MQRDPILPVHGSCRLLLEVTSLTKKKPVKTMYAVRWLESHPDVGRPAYRLTKLRADGTSSEDVHDVILTEHSWHCSCADFTYRRHNTEGGCKHTRAVNSLRKELRQ